MHIHMYIHTCHGYLLYTSKTSKDLRRLGNDLCEHHSSHSDRVTKNVLCFSFCNAQFLKGFSIPILYVDSPHSSRGKSILQHTHARTHWTKETEAYERVKTPLLLQLL